MPRKGRLVWLLASAAAARGQTTIAATCPPSRPGTAPTCPGNPTTSAACDDEGYCCWDAGTSTCFANEVEPFAGLACDDATWFATAGCTCNTVIEGAIVTIEAGPAYSDGNELSCPACSGLGLDAEVVDDGMPNMALQLIPTAGPMPIADVAVAVSSVVFTPYHQRSGGVECAHPYRVQYNFGLARFVPGLGNHFYRQFVPTGNPDTLCSSLPFGAGMGCTWFEAQDYCEHPDRDLLGLVGYLPTFTSARERAMCAVSNSTYIGWVGRTDAAREGEWRWVTGPEGCPWSYGQSIHRSWCRLGFRDFGGSPDPCYGRDCGKGLLVGVQPSTYTAGSFMAAPMQVAWIPNTYHPFNGGSPNNTSGKDFGSVGSIDEDHSMRLMPKAPVFKCEWGGVGTLCMELAAVSQTVTLVINTTACPDVDECVTGCNTCHNTECNGLTPQQACFDPNHDAASLRDWECRCTEAGYLGWNVMDPASCTLADLFDECEEPCASCENDLCSDNSQDCVDTFPSLNSTSDWVCRCRAHSSAFVEVVGNVTSCVYDECAMMHGSMWICNGPGPPQNCTDPDFSVLDNWQCSCANGVTATQMRADCSSPTSAPPTQAPPTPTPLSVAPTTPAPPTAMPLSAAPPTPAPPTPAPPTPAPPTPAPPTQAPPTAAPLTPSPSSASPSPFLPITNAPLTSPAPRSVAPASSQTAPSPTPVPTEPKSKAFTKGQRKGLQDVGKATISGSLATFRALGCSVDDVDLGLDEPLDFEFSPTGIALGDSKMRYLLGAVVANVLIMTGCSVLVLLVAFFAPMGGPDANLTRRLAALRAPGMLMIPFMLLLPGTCLAAARLLFSGEAATYMYVVAALGLALCCVSPYFLYRTVVSHVKDMAYLTDDPRCAARDASTSDNAGHRQQKPLTGWMRSVYRFAFGEQIWVSRGGDSYFADKMGYVFDSYRAGQEHMVLVEVMLSVALCFLAAFRPQGGAMCHLRNSVISLMFVAWLAAVVVQRPFLAPLQNYWTQVIAVFSVIALITITAAIMVEAHPDGPLFSVAAFCLFSTAFLTIGKGLYDFLAYAVDICLNRRAGAWEAARRKAFEGERIFELEDDFPSRPRSTSSVGDSTLSVSFPPFLTEYNTKPPDVGALPLPGRRGRRVSAGRAMPSPQAMYPGGRGNIQPQYGGSSLERSFNRPAADALSLSITSSCKRSPLRMQASLTHHSGRAALLTPMATPTVKPRELGFASAV